MMEAVIVISHLDWRENEPLFFSFSKGRLRTLSAARRTLSSVEMPALGSLPAETLRIRLDRRAGTLIWQIWSMSFTPVRRSH